MLLGIDHLVIAVHDPDAAARGLEARLGLAVTGGGRHEGRGTHNRLVFLGDSYLELIGVDDASLVGTAATNAVGRAALDLLDDGREGLATLALATDDAAAEVARLRASGSAIGDPVPGSRSRPDGEVVRWITAFPELGPEAPPFLIEHEPAGREWGPTARAARAAYRHPTGGIVRLARLTVPVRSPEVAAARWSAVLALRFTANTGDRLTVMTSVGSQEIVLVPRAAGVLSTVDLSADTGSSPVDMEHIGLRWRRRGRPPAPR